MSQDSVAPACEHRWYWRRRRNQGFGFWECITCGLRLGPVPLDKEGRAAQTPEEAMSDE